MARDNDFHRGKVDRSLSYGLDENPIFMIRGIDQFSKRVSRVINVINDKFTKKQFKNKTMANQNITMSQETSVSYFTDWFGYLRNLFGSVL